MSSNDDTAIKGTNAHNTVITDLYNNPVTIDNNVAHLSSPSAVTRRSRVSTSSHPDLRCV